MSRVPLHHLFVADRDPLAPAARRGSQILSWRKLSADVAGMAATVRATGAKRGALYAEDGYRFTVGLLGLLHGGADVVLPPNGLPSTVAAIEPHADVMVADDLPAPERLPLLPIVEDVEGAPPTGALDPRAATVVFFTSGSTGAPKAISKGLWELDHDAYVFELGWGRQLVGATTYGMVTHQHLYGLTFRLLWSLSAGRPFTTEIDEFWETLLARLEAPAVLIASPAHLMRLSGLPPLPPQRRPLAVFAGGAPLPLAAAQEARAILGVQPTEMYGSTETGVVATRLQRAEGEPWSPLAGVDVARDADGCLQVRWPDVPDLPPFPTQDRIEQLPDGRFKLLGRADRIVKIEAKRVSLPEVEDVLARHELVAEVAVVVIDGPPAQLGAVVVLSEAGQAELKARGGFRLGRRLRRDIADRLEPTAMPKRWRFVSKLPHSHLGKRDGAAMRALFERPGGR